MLLPQGLTALGVLCSMAPAENRCQGSHHLSRERDLGQLHLRHERFDIIVNARVQVRAKYDHKSEPIASTAIGALNRGLCFLAEPFQITQERFLSTRIMLTTIEFLEITQIVFIFDGIIFPFVVCRVKKRLHMTAAVDRWQTTQVQPRRR